MHHYTITVNGLNKGVFRGQLYVGLRGRVTPGIPAIIGLPIEQVLAELLVGCLKIRCNIRSFTTLARWKNETGCSP